LEEEEEAEEEEKRSRESDEKMADKATGLPSPVSSDDSKGET
jgi:hypothetical protein